MKVETADTFYDDIGGRPPQDQIRILKRVGKWTTAKESGSVPFGFRDHPLGISDSQANRYGKLCSFVTVKGFVAIYSVQTENGETVIRIIMHDKHDIAYSRVERI